MLIEFHLVYTAAWLCVCVLCVYVWEISMCSRSVLHANGISSSIYCSLMCVYVFCVYVWEISMWFGVSCMLMEFHLVYTAAWLCDGVLCVCVGSSMWFRSDLNAYWISSSMHGSLMCVYVYVCFCVLCLCGKSDVVCEYRLFLCVCLCVCIHTYGVPCMPIICTGTCICYVHVYMCICSVCISVYACMCEHVISESLAW
jgi:hypothetical protein